MVHLSGSHTGDYRPYLGRHGLRRRKDVPSKLVVHLVNAGGGRLSGNRAHYSSILVEVMNYSPTNPQAGGQPDRGSSPVEGVTALYLSGYRDAPCGWSRMGNDCVRFHTASTADTAWTADPRRLCHLRAQLGYM